MVITNRSPDPPSESVIEAIGLSGVAVKLDGGEGQSFRVGTAVLKPTREDDE